MAQALSTSMENDPQQPQPASRLLTAGQKTLIRNTNQALSTVERCFRSSVCAGRARGTRRTHVPQDRTSPGIRPGGVSEHIVVAAAADLQADWSVTVGSDQQLGVCGFGSQRLHCDPYLGHRLPFVHR